MKYKEIVTLVGAKSYPQKVICRAYTLGGINLFLRMFLKKNTGAIKIEKYFAIPEVKEYYDRFLKVLDECKPPYNKYKVFKEYVLGELDLEYYKLSSRKDRNNYSIMKHHGVTSSMLIPGNKESAYKKRVDKFGHYNNLDKFKQTCIERYGVESFSQTEQYREQYIQTSLEKFGVENTFQLDWVREKAENAREEKYGDKVYSKTQHYKDRVSEIVDKSKNTCLKKYGVEHFNQSEEGKIKNKQKMIEKYGVEYPHQIGFLNFDDLNENFVREKFIKDGRFLQDDFMEYFNILSPITMSSYKEKFDILEPNFYKKSKKQQDLFDSIKTENKLMDDRKLIEPLEIDILLPDIKLAIEYDGLMFHSRGIDTSGVFVNKDKDYHVSKTNLAELKGYQLFHVFESDDIEIWKSMINNKLGLNTKIFARKCAIKEVDKKTAKSFIESNHLQGYHYAAINYGLYYQDILVSIMTFGKSRFNKRYEWELIRFCSLKNYNVVGGASKLLSYFRKKHTGSIISYANRRWSNGDLYRRLGFIEKGITSPNYFYFKPGSTLLYSRTKFQKHKLPNLLETFDPNKTEEHNMFANGFRQIFDCGNYVFVLE